jgi:sortase A
VELLLWALGLGCLVTSAGFYLWGIVSARRTVAVFESAIPFAASRSQPDLSLWSPKRIQAWKDSFSRAAPEAMAVLRIPKINLEVPVLEGTDDWTLNRAVGHIEDTAAPGGPGNAGIAGHRDGFFRGLKDVVTGDALELKIPQGTTHFRIERIWIVNPDDVSVLDPTPTAAVTLVTCFPFYFVGSAPQRYIVRATIVRPPR